MIKLPSTQEKQVDYFVGGVLVGWVSAMTAFYFILRGPNIRLPW